MANNTFCPTVSYVQLRRQFLAPPNLYHKTQGRETRHSFPITNGWSFISNLFFDVERTTLPLL